MKRYSKKNKYLFTLFFTSLILLMLSCNQNTVFDFTPPKINIQSPVAETIYPTPYVKLDYSITEVHFRSAWFTINGGDPVSLPKSGTRRLHLQNGEYNLVLTAQDKYDNTASDSLHFYVDTGGGK